MSEVYLFAEDEVKAGKPRIDLNRLTVQNESMSELEFLKSVGVKALPLTDELRQIVLTERAGKAGERTVTLGNYGPIVLVRIADGCVVNKFTGHDINRPLKLTRETVQQLRAILGGAAKENE